MNTAEAAISSNRLRVVKNKRPILFDLNVTVQNAQITGLVGPGGSGKTTLIRSIVGVQKITSGELMVLGIEAGSRQLHSKIGYMSQSPSVYGDLTVEQNLRYFATITRTTSEDIERVLKFVHLEAQKRQLVET